MAAETITTDCAIAGGGRYDNLVKLISGGRVDLPALGFGMGDVKLAFVLGVFVTFRSWASLPVAVFAAFVIGGLIGAAIGLLLAPESGEEMRGQVGGFVDERVRDFGDAVSEGKVAADQARTAMLAALQRESAPDAPAEESAN